MDDNVRTLDFSKDNPQVMPEDIFEGPMDGGMDFDPADAVPQFSEDGPLAEAGTIVTADFGTMAEPPLTAVTLFTSRPFFMLEIPSLGIEAPLDVDTAASLFDSLGAAINEL